MGFRSYPRSRACPAACLSDDQRVWTRCMRIFTIQRVHAGSIRERAVQLTVPDPRSCGGISVSTIAMHMVDHILSGSRSDHVLGIMSSGTSQSEHVRRTLLQLGWRHDEVQQRGRNQQVFPPLIVARRRPAPQLPSSKKCDGLKLGEPIQKVRGVRTSLIQSHGYPHDRILRGWVSQKRGSQTRHRGALQSSRVRNRAGADIEGTMPRVLSTP